MLGVFCNALVCLAVWLCMGARTTVDKIAAIIFPISAFVAAGFEHSIANMYFMPLAMLIQQFGPPTPGAAQVTWLGTMQNLLPVICGNLVGGSVLVGLTYHLVYRRGERTGPADTPPATPTAPKDPNREK